MATRKPIKTYSELLAKPNLSNERRIALTLLNRVKEIQDNLFEIEIPFGEPLSFEVEVESRASDNLCVNCGNLIKMSLLYYSDYCSQFSACIRYVRKAFDENLAQTQDKQLGMSMLFTHLYNGKGYPAKDRYLSFSIKRLIFNRDNFVCQICGGKASEIDHISNSSSDPSNLQALCAPCNIRKMQKNARVITKTDNPEEFEKFEQIFEFIARRIAAPAPSKICDDHLRWNKAQPRIRAARTKKLAAETSLMKSA